MRYILIVGNGRSGTNWLLDILDASRLTFCRSEPDGIYSSPMRKIHDLEFKEQVHDSDAFGNHWDVMVEWTRLHIGIRDHQITTPKKYIHPVSLKLGLARWPNRPKIRKLLSFIMPELRQEEILMPWWIGDRYKLTQAIPVFKIDLDPWLVSWILQHRSQTTMLHIVRHPGGILNSTLERFWNKCSPEKATKELEINRNKLRTILKYEAEWADRFGNIDKMNYAETVLWLWCYKNERLFHIGKDCPNYMHIVYEKLTQDPVNYAKTIYQFCKLPWNPSVEDLIRAGTKESVWEKLSSTPTVVAEAWKAKLSQEYQTLTKRVLSDSFMENWWNKSNISQSVEDEDLPSTDR